MDNRPAKTIALVGIGSLALYGLAFLGFLAPWLNTLVFWFILGLAVFLTARSLLNGCLLVLVELAIGSKGYLFSETLFSQVISLRQALFLIVMIAGIVVVIRRRQSAFWLSRYRWWFVGLISMLGVGAVIGWARNPHDVWFHDINAYAFLALVFPFFEAIRSWEHVRKILVWLGGAALALALFTIGTSLIFSTVYYRPGFVKATEIDAAQLARLAEPATSPENARLGQTTNVNANRLQVNWSDVSDERPVLYRWLRDTGTAEVAYLGQRIFRVFSGSHLFLVAGLLMFFGVFARLRSPLRSLLSLILLTSCLVLGTALILSFSRSLWLGAGVGFLLVLILNGKRGLGRLGLLALSVTFLGVVLTAVVPGAIDVIRERFFSTAAPTSEVAAFNRLQLLPEIREKIQQQPWFGSGFGTTVTYRSLVPGTDVVEYVKVFLFEWAYLDLIVKIGLVGLAAYVLWLLRIAWQGVTAIRSTTGLDRGLTVGLLGGLAAVAVANIFTPFLNHPLGIGIVLLSAVSFIALPNPNERR